MTRGGGVNVARQATLVFFNLVNPIKLTFTEVHFDVQFLHPNMAISGIVEGSVEHQKAFNPVGVCSDVERR